MMVKIRVLVDYIKLADIYAGKLKIALGRVNKFAPVTVERMASLDEVESAFSDVVAMRFIKLQDVIGSKVFPLVLMALYEDDDAQSFIDKLNKLETMDYVESANWWLSMREMRNQVAHDYPDDLAVLAKHFNVLVRRADELLIFWNDLKVKITPLIDKKN